MNYRKVYNVKQNKNELIKNVLRGSCSNRQDKRVQKFLWLDLWRRLLHRTFPTRLPKLLIEKEKNKVLKHYYIN
jgi:hypothetical protein